MVFLPHTNTVILLEPYCGTMTEPGLPVGIQGIQGIHGYTWEYRVYMGIQGIQGIQNTGYTTGNPGSVIVPQYDSSKITVFVWGKNTILKFLGNTK